MFEADDLLAGPRGRRLLDCLRPFRDESPAEITKVSLISAIGTSVNDAMYWQDPEEEMLETPEALKELRLIADKVVAFEDTAWMEAGFDSQSQVWLKWVTSMKDWNVRPESLASSAEKWTEWRVAVHADEAKGKAEANPDPQSDSGSYWWSAPVREARPTSAKFGEHGATGLWWVEDSFGWNRADLIEVEVSPAARIFEVKRAEDWAWLCRTYPLDVSWSKRRNWFLTTGQDLRWLIPDWGKVAHDFDGVYLSVMGYLHTAGRAITVDSEFSTVLAGWNPGETYWLNDVVVLSDRFESWASSRVDGSDDWRNA